MPSQIYSDAFSGVLDAARQAYLNGGSKTVDVNGESRKFTFPYPSPVDWRDNWIYFLMVDRFNNPVKDPNSMPGIPWDKSYGQWQGGTINGVREKLGYLDELGAGAIWISPVLKQSAPPEWAYNYHGYAAQDFLTIDGRFGSDGSSATAEAELILLVEEAHARGIYVILDIVLNHTARVFDYEYQGRIEDDFQDGQVLGATAGQEPPVEWLNGLGFPRSDWRNSLPAPGQLSPDDAVWPSDLQRADFFRRKGGKITDKVGADGFVKGDFGTMRQLVVEYDATQPGLEPVRNLYGKAPVQNILVHIYRYLIAKFDIDGFRIDTVKYVRPDMVETFCNAIREYALSIGKANFFTFGEIYDDENTLSAFIGRNSTDGFGMDAALDFPLFYQLPSVVKGRSPVESLRNVFTDRKDREKSLLSSHGEAGKYFVSFLDNHDQKERFNHRGTPVEQVLCGLALLFTLQGIPCLYYGTEQGLQGTTDMDPNAGLGYEFVREALWGKTPAAFDMHHQIYQHIQAISRLRYNEPALSYGRIYFRELSANGQDFGQARGTEGVIAFSRILGGSEILVIANMHTQNTFKGFMVVDIDLHRTSKKFGVVYSNLARTGQGSVHFIANANFYGYDNDANGDKLIGSYNTVALYIELEAMEVQILSK